MEDGSASIPVPSPAVIQALQVYLATVVPPMLLGALPDDEVFVAAAARQAHLDALGRFASSLGEALVVEGWANANGIRSYRLTTEIRQSKHATLTLLRVNQGADLELRTGNNGPDESTSDETGDGAASAAAAELPLAAALASVAPQVQIVSSGAGLVGGGGEEADDTSRGGLGGLFSGLQRLAAGWLAPLAADCADLAARQASGDSDDAASSSVAHRSNDGDSGSGGSGMSSAGATMAAEVAKKAGELRSALENVRAASAVPALHLEVHPLVAAVVKVPEHREALGAIAGAADGAGGSESSSGGNVNVDALGLGPQTLALPSNCALSELPDYTTFLNDCQRLVTSSWKREVASLAALTRAPFAASAAAELAFWTSLHASLSKGSSAFNSPGAKVTLQVLRGANRNIGMNLMDMEKSLARGLAHSADALDFLKEFPIEAMETAPHLPGLLAAVDTTFAVVQRKVRNSEHAFKLERVVDFLAAVERAVTTRATALLEAAAPHSKKPLNSFSRDLTTGGIESVNGLGSSSKDTGKLTGLPYKDFTARVQEFGSLYARWVEAFYGPSHPALQPDGLIELLGSVNSDDHAATSGVTESSNGSGGAGSGTARGASAGGRSTRAASAATAVSGGSSGSGSLPLADFLREQAGVKGRLLRPAADTRAGNKVMRELLDALENGAGLPRLASCVAQVARFRKSHEELTSTLADFLAAGVDLPPGSLESVEDAYAVLARTAPPLGVQAQHGDALAPCLAVYYRAVGQVEAQVTQVLTQKLDAATTADEMFAVFRRYNRLFVRPAIQSAVSRYQAEILATVQAAVSSLRTKQAAGYEGSAAHRLACLRDVPPVSGHIAWAQKIKAQLQHLESQLGAVMGEQWAKLCGAEGQALSDELHKLTRALNPQPTYDAWVATCRSRLEESSLDPLVLVLREDFNTNASSSSATSASGKATRSKSKSGGAAAIMDAAPSLRLEVNFDDHTLEVLKEVRNLTWLQFQVPATIRAQAAEAEARYPTAVALKGALRTYAAARASVPAAQLMLLEEPLKAFRLDVQQAFQKVKRVPRHANALASSSSTAVQKEHQQVTWATQQVDPPGFQAWVSSITECAFRLEHAAEDLAQRSVAIETLLQDLASAAYTPAALGGVVASLQALVDDMGRGDLYSNLAGWVATLDQRVEAILVKRLAAAARGWARELNRDQSITDGSNKKNGRSSRLARTTAGSTSNALVLSAAAAFAKNASPAVLERKRRARRQSVVYGSTSVTAHADKENNETGGSDATIVDAAPEDEDEFVIEDLQVEPTTHAVLHAQRRMFLSPPLDDARRHWMAKLQSDVVGVCANLPRLHVQDLSMASRQRAPGHTTTYGNKLVQQVPAKALESCWRALDRRLGEASTFVSGWLQYQALWGLQAKDVVDRLTFEARVLALEAYQRSSEGGSGHGGGYGKMPPLSHTTEDGVMLGAWCLVQKRLKGLGLLTTAQVQRLDSLGFNWAQPAPSISSGSGSGGGASAERGSEEEARQKAAAAVAAYTAAEPSSSSQDNNGQGNGAGGDNSEGGEKHLHGDGLGGVGTIGLGLWVALLSDLKKSRAEIDTSATSHGFGPLVVDYSQVQAKVADRYDAWQRSLQDEFGKVLFAAIGACHATLSNAKVKLEAANLKTCDPKDTIEHVSYLQEARSALPHYQALVQGLQDAEKLLQRQRSPAFAFRPDWVYASNLDGALSQVAQILAKNGDAMDQCLGDVKQRVRTEDAALGAKLVQLEHRWRNDTPEWNCLVVNAPVVLGAGATASGRSSSRSGSGVAPEWQALFEYVCATFQKNGSTSCDDPAQYPLGRAALRAALADAEVNLRVADLLELPPELAHKAAVSSSGGDGDEEDAGSERCEKALADLDQHSPQGGDWVSGAEFVQVALACKGVGSALDALSLLKGYADELEALRATHVKLTNAKHKLNMDGATPLPAHAVNATTAANSTSTSGSSEALEERRLAELDREDLGSSSFSSGGGGSRDADRLMSDLAKDVAYQEACWLAVAPHAQTMVSTHARKWADKEADPKKVRREMEALAKELTLAAGPRFASHAAFESLRAHVQQRQRALLQLQELRSDAIKPRHLASVLTKVGRMFPSSSSTPTGAVTRAVLRDLSLGDFLPRKLELHKRFINDVVSGAQGEMALEEFLRKVEDSWTAYELELVPFSNNGGSGGSGGSGVMLLKGWDALFGKLDDDLASLHAMKQSPYFKQSARFDEAAEKWEGSLTRAQQTFDLWVDVQRRWVYLGGIFFGSADIKAQLPSEFARFQACDREFVDLMRKVRKKPLALEATHALAPEEHGKRARLLEKQADAMGKIQKALGEYLEQQRAAFSRFYFVGDEDLLEIVGNSKEARKVAPHLSKMFAAIAAVKFGARDGVADTEASNNGGAYVVAMIAKEGESVPLGEKHAVRCGPDPLLSGGGALEPVGVKAWLTGLESAMATSLSDALGAALVDAKLLPNPSAQDASSSSSQGASAAAGVSVFGAALDQWLGPLAAQVAVLATQCLWAASVESALREGSAAGGVDGTGASAVAGAEAGLEAQLKSMAKNVLAAFVAPPQRRKYEQLITELVHQRDVTRLLRDQKVTAPDDFGWLVHLRAYAMPATSISSSSSSAMTAVECRMANTAFAYGFEYQGVGERLVQTPLTDRCYLTLTQALHLRMGGNPFGPAGTGKTESVKALGNQLGRFVLVFNCDEAFDFAAMGRLFAGLCQVGAWGCFDEFNRLEERILSAVSSQILTIQRGLQEHAASVDLLGRPVRLNPSMAIFVTMNPGYAGRSELPDNLKALFRAVAMATPNFKLIAQVLLFSQGVASAEDLAAKVVLLFQMCAEQLSPQQHYDFGLRALKSVLVGTGDLKRAALAKRSSSNDDGENGDNESGASMAQVEREVLVRSCDNTVLPKLVKDDLPLYAQLRSATFPDRSGSRDPCLGDGATAKKVRAALKTVCREVGLSCHACWRDKVLQLWQVVAMRRGVMLVGPTGSGKTTSWRCLLAALERVDGVKGECHVIDAKAIDKESLYGTLDPTTLEWTDGVFTAILRGVLANPRGDAGASSRRHWVVFDGDVDPDWAENLNSVLDDNGLLTLPSGERLAVPDNMKLFMEVDTLKHTTLATVSRCGMVWYSDDAVSPGMALEHTLTLLERGSSSSSFLGGGNMDSDLSGSGGGDGDGSSGDNEVAESRKRFVHELRPLFLGADYAEENARLQENSKADDDDDDEGDDDDDEEEELGEGDLPGFDAEAAVPAVLRWALGRDGGTDAVHVMEATRARLLCSLLTLLRRGLSLVLEYNEQHPDAPMEGTHLTRFVQRWCVHACVWGLGGAMPWKGRESIAAQMLQHPQLSSLVAGSGGGGLTGGVPSAVDLRVRVEDGEWEPWSLGVPTKELEARQVTGSDAVIPTTDTLRHEEAIRACLAAHKPLVLCGPPGSGKTMTLTAVLSNMPELVLVPLNFSSTTTPDLLLKTFAQYCEVVKSPRGLVMQPLPALGEGKWLVVFCDEVNLAAEDKYGTVKVVSFLRQLAEQQGFYRCGKSAGGSGGASSSGGGGGGLNQWISLRRVQIVGACNPPTDAGRVAMSPRFLRHAPLVLVDYPPPSSLAQIYGAFVRATMKVHGGDLLPYVGPVTDAMIDFYGRNQQQFTTDAAPQYVYSPRELSRWVRALFEALAPLDAPPSPDELCCLWAHEGLRLFHDRLMDPHEKAWCNATINAVAERHFPGLSSTDVSGVVLARPLLYSTWLGAHYGRVQRDSLRRYMGARLQAFYEEELDCDLVMFDEVLDHVLRIDSVLRNPMGHLLLVGESGTGKTVLTKFVAWINGLSIFQIKASRKYTLANFDEDLREVMKRSGVEGEKVCFLFDEANALSSAFLEKMNALLASGEVPGLFEGDDRAQLLTACRDAAHKKGALVESEDELFRMFTRAVQRNLHVVFTMNPSGGEWKHRCTASPALFNRCVVDWFGTWSDQSLAQVATHFTQRLDTGEASDGPGRYKAPKGSGQLLAVADAAFGQGARRNDDDDNDHDSGDEGALSSFGSNGIGLRQALVAALVHIHAAVRDATAEAGKRSHAARHWCSPRDFLDLIKKFVALVGEKRDELEEQQRHLFQGLARLTETQTSVAELQGSLSLVEDKLKEKNNAANNKLGLMLDKQSEAEKEKEKQQELSVQLEARDAEIAKRSSEVQLELAEAEPALLSAKDAVGAIKKAQLDEVRALRNPPKLVQLTMEAVCSMLGHKQATDWDEIRKIIRKDDFIAAVLAFDSTKLRARQIEDIERKYMADPSVSVESVLHASKACGPLFQWATSQVSYCHVVARVTPLREEVDTLQAQSQGLREGKEAADAKVQSLGAAIEVYKEEYAAAIRDIDAIKVELENVKAKVQRAETLLKSLASEQGRWEASSTTFEAQLGTLCGDGLLAAAFATYGGIFDHKTRQTLRDKWRTLAEDLGIPHRGDLCDAPAVYLSKASQRLQWQQWGMASDDLCVENAVVLDRFHRFPLVVDPSGMATRFLLAKYADQRISQTSFLDASFLKALASAVRFGLPLLVHDAEHVDPVLNPVLNREIQKNGRRTLIRLGGEDVDYNPKFLVFLVTRNPLAQFAPDLCSRVTLVNFTVTPASLEAQALGQVLRCERPDVEQKRRDVLRLQGEQSVKLRSLEDALLAELSSVTGNILDDDAVAMALAKLKSEAEDVEKDMAKSAEVMADVKRVADTYTPLAKACAQTFFVLEQLSATSSLYQFTIQFFLRLLGHALAQPRLGDGDYDAEAAASSSSSGIDKKGGGSGDGASSSGKGRLERLRQRFFRLAALRVSRSLLRDDQLAFSVRLAQIKLACDAASSSGGSTSSLPPSEAEVDALLKSSGPLASVSAAAAAAGVGSDGSSSSGGGIVLSEAQSAAAVALAAAVPACKGLPKALGPAGQPPSPAWATFLSTAAGSSESNGTDDDDGSDSSSCSNSSNSSGGVPAVPQEGWMSAADAKLPARVALLELLVVKCLRPDKLVPALEQFVVACFGSHHPWRGNCPGASALSDLQHLVEDELSLVAASSSGNGESGAATTDESGTSGGGLTPVLLVANGAGQDASGRVEALATLRKVPLFAVSMGSAEGLAEAEKLVRRHAKSGNAWVLLRNVHLVPHWLDALEQKLHALASTTSPTFRLFLTADSGPKLPASLVRASSVLVSDAPHGVKASLQRVLKALPPSRLSGGPAERRHLYLLAAWHHAVVGERLRYAPLAGFSKRHEFSDADATCSLAAIDQWCLHATGGGSGGGQQSSSRNHLDPDTEIPWQALKAVLGESTYGGRVDSVFDQAVLKSFLDQTFTPAAFRPGFKPGGCADAPELPPPGSAEALLKWVDLLPDVSPPTWVGLPPSAEAVLLAHTGQKVLRQVGLLQDGGLDDGDDDDVNVSASGSDDASSPMKASGKLAALAHKVGEWLTSLQPLQTPLKLAQDRADQTAALAAARSNNTSGNDSSSAPSPGEFTAALARCLSREVAFGVKLLSRVAEDLEEVLAFCSGTARPTNALRQLVADLGGGSTPLAWKQSFVCAPACRAAVDAWLSDFNRRLKHTLTLAPMPEPSSEAKTYEYWLGGFFSPEAFVTATRQHTAQCTGKALDDLVPCVQLVPESQDNNGRGDESSDSAVGFVLRGLVLEGAAWHNGELAIADVAHGPVHRARFTWQPKQQPKISHEEGEAGSRGRASIEVPLYLNEGRAALLATVELARRNEQPAHAFYQRGAALVAWDSACD